MRFRILVLALLLGISACARMPDDGSAPIPRHHTSPHGAYAGAGSGWSGY